jgi:hypothetical protein
VRRFGPFYPELRQLLVEPGHQLSIKACELNLVGYQDEVIRGSLAGFA